MTLFQLMGLLSTFALALPIIYLILTRLAWYKCIPALLIYSVLIFAYNLTSLGYIPVPASFVQDQSLTNNLFDTPLMLCFMIYFSQTAAYRNSLLVILTVYLAYEVVVLLLLGFNRQSSTVIMAPGLLITLSLAFIFFYHYVKLTLVNHKALGKLLMVLSVLLSYVVYAFIYVVFYLLDTQFVDDTRLIYFAVTFFSSILLCIGIMIERKRVRHLAELNKTREELKALYGQEGKKTTTPFEAVVFKFEPGKTY
ncbi:MAG: hypothetical protein ABWZ25_05700 [Chitinophagaceae bacterium]